MEKHPVFTDYKIPYCKNAHTIQSNLCYQFHFFTSQWYFFQKQKKNKF